MRPLATILILAIIALTSCLVIEEEPILLLNPNVDISAHVKDRKIYATALINANPHVLTAGNIPTTYKFTGELAIFNVENGNPIDVIEFGGGGLAQVYSVNADTLTHERFIVIASGTIEAYADIENDQNFSNDRLISSGDFYQEAQFVISEMVGF